MRALILNSGLGSRMGELTKEQPKCMTEISDGDTILSRQLKMLLERGIKDIVITTGAHSDCLVSYCESLELPIGIKYVKNELYRSTNYIYSIYCAGEYLFDDIILMHGDLVFDGKVLDALLRSDKSVMTVSSRGALPEKDFKAVIEGGRIRAVGVEFFENALEAQPLYKLMKADWMVWLKRIYEYIESGEPLKRACYAEKALNEVSGELSLYPLDIADGLCGEIDNIDDLERIRRMLCHAG